MSMIHPMPKSKKELKSISRQVNLAIISPPPTTEYLNWSDHPIEFSRIDHPPQVPRPGHAPMVLKAQIWGYDDNRVFMDTWSGINLIYAQTLRAMNISLMFLKPKDCSFHGIIPGSVNIPLGRIEPDVCFGTQKTLDERNWHLKSWTVHHNILQSSEDTRFRVSWQFLTTIYARSCWSY
jgi:hypothetical protein